MLKTIGVVVALLDVLAAAGIGWLVYDGRRAPAGTSEYVALGSSFGAGPGVISADPNAKVSPASAVTAQLYFVLTKARRTADKERLIVWFNVCSKCTWQLN